MDFENVIGYPIDKDIIADTPLLQSNVPKYYYPLYIKYENTPLRTPK